LTGRQVSRDPIMQTCRQRIKYNVVECDRAQQDGQEEGWVETARTVVLCRRRRRRRSSVFHVVRCLDCAPYAICICICIYIYMCVCVCVVWSPRGSRHERNTGITRPPAGRLRSPCTKHLNVQELSNMVFIMTATETETQSESLGAGI
jgi:hypothetical protein